MNQRHECASGRPHPEDVGGPGHDTDNEQDSEHGGPLPLGAESGEVGPGGPCGEDVGLLGHCVPEVSNHEHQHCMHEAIEVHRIGSGHLDVDRDGGRRVMSREALQRRVAHDALFDRGRMTMGSDGVSGTEA